MYDARAPADIVFAPLNNTKEMDAHHLMEHLSNDNHLKKYLDIIRNEPRYPVLVDAAERVLSLPPIINGNHSKITLSTRNVFIEVTATDRSKAELVLNMVVTAFSSYAAERFAVEAVDIDFEATPSTAARRDRTPNLSPRTLDVSVEYIRSCLGLAISGADAATKLRRMSLVAAASADERVLHVVVPVTRADIIAPCDVMEDVAIAVGYDNLPKSLPTGATVGRQQPLASLSEALRHECASAGYTELLSLSLVSHDENFKVSLGLCTTTTTRVRAPLGSRRFVNEVAVSVRRT